MSYMKRHAMKIDDIWSDMCLNRYTNEMGMSFSDVVDCCYSDHKVGDCWICNQFRGKSHNFEPDPSPPKADCLQAPHHIVNTLLDEHGDRKYPTWTNGLNPARPITEVVEEQILKTNLRLHLGGLGYTQEAIESVVKAELAVLRFNRIKTPEPVTEPVKATPRHRDRDDFLRDVFR